MSVRSVELSLSEGLGEKAEGEGLTVSPFLGTVWEAGMIGDE